MTVIVRYDGLLYAGCALCASPLLPVAHESRAVGSVCRHCGAVVSDSGIWREPTGLEMLTAAVADPWPL